MCGLFHKASLLCFYRTSGRTFHKYNSSIAPIELTPAVKKSLARPMSFIPLAHGVLLADLGCPIAYLSQCCLNSLGLVDCVSRHPSNRDVRTVRKFPHRLPACSRDQLIRADAAYMHPSQTTCRNPPSSKFLNYPRLIANDSINVSRTMNMTADSR